MDICQKEELIKLAGEKIRFDCPMALYNTFRVGGKGEALYRADNAEELAQVIAFLNKENIPHVTIGRGSNLLIKDTGLKGLVIILEGPLASIKNKEKEDLTILAGAGLPIVDLLAYCRKKGLGGLEWLAGIPGTVGGAVIMNAGAFGSEIGPRVREVHVITSKGDIEKKYTKQLGFSYRNFEIERGAVVIFAKLQLEMESEQIVVQRITNYLKKRKQSQPLEFPSAGSVFKNPPDEYAARLIEAVRLKGKRIGGAMVSEKHANFIVNTGGATAKDILDLIFLVQTEVRNKTGIELEPEIKVLGD